MNIVNDIFHDRDRKYTSLIDLDATFSHGMELDAWDQWTWRSACLWYVFVELENSLVNHFYESYFNVTVTYNFLLWHRVVL